MVFEGTRIGGRGADFDGREAIGEMGHSNFFGDTSLLAAYQTSDIRLLAYLYWDLNYYRYHPSLFFSDNVRNFLAIRGPFCNHPAPVLHPPEFPTNTVILPDKEGRI